MVWHFFEKSEQTSRTYSEFGKQPDTKSSPEKWRCSIEMVICCYRRFLRNLQIMELNLSNTLVSAWTIQYTCCAHTIPQLDVSGEPLDADRLRQGLGRGEETRTLDGIQTDRDNTHNIASPSSAFHCPSVSFQMSLDWLPNEPNTPHNETSLTIPMPRTRYHAQKP